MFGHCIIQVIILRKGYRLEKLTIHIESDKTRKTIYISHWNLLWPANCGGGGVKWRRNDPQKVSEARISRKKRRTLCPNGVGSKQCTSEPYILFRARNWTSLPENTCTTRRLPTPSFIIHGNKQPQSPWLRANNTEVKYGRLSSPVFIKYPPNAKKNVNSRTISDRLDLPSLILFYIYIRSYIIHCSIFVGRGRGKEKRNQKWSMMNFTLIFTSTENFDKQCSVNVWWWFASLSKSGKSDYKERGYNFYIL